VTSAILAASGRETQSMGCIKNRLCCVCGVTSG